MANRIEELNELGWGYKEIAELLEELKAMIGSNAPTTREEPTQDFKLRRRICKILHNLGIPVNLLGYRYLTEAIYLTVNDFNMIDAMTGKLYPALAKTFGTTASRVERAIRHSIEVCWDRGNFDLLNKYFGYTVNRNSCKATNSEFISKIADTIILGEDFE